MLLTMEIGDIEVTRLIVGGNPFTGKSAEYTREAIRIAESR